jgi:hypothetical protein
MPSLSTLRGKKLLSVMSQTSKFSVTELGIRTKMKRETVRQYVKTLYDLGRLQSHRIREGSAMCVSERYTLHSESTMWLAGEVDLNSSELKSHRPTFGRSVCDWIGVLKDISMDLSKGRFVSEDELMKHKANLDKQIEAYKVELKYLESLANNTDLWDKRRLPIRLRPWNVYGTDHEPDPLD